MVLTHGTPDTGAPLLIDLCDDQPEQWATLLKALDHVDDAITFGQFLDALGQPTHEHGVTNPGLHDHRDDGGANWSERAK